jgi:hypothetical protein
VKPLLVAALVGTVTVASGARSQVSVLTYHNDNARTGQNLAETTLTPSNLDIHHFGKLFTQAVDGFVFAQPLYLSNLAMPGRGIRDVVFVATEHDSVYAFDADSNLGTSSKPLWHAVLLPTGATPVPNPDTGSWDIVPEIGITGTPVIDETTGTLYVVAKSKENGGYVQRLHALDVTTGAEKLGGPVRISGWFVGIGDGSVNGTLTFDPLRQHNRSGLLLSNGVVYAAFASHGDVTPYHGWMLGYQATTLRKVAVWVTTPNGLTDPSGYPIGAGGIWQGGAGPAADSNGSIYFETGNGTFDVDLPGGIDYGDSFVKLDTKKGLAVGDYFTPENQLTLDDYDADLGSGGVLLLPDTAGSPSHPHLLVGCGKEGSIYLLDRDNMGQYSPGSNNIVQFLQYTIGGTWSMPAYFNSGIYYAGVDDALKLFQLGPASILTPAVSGSPTAFGYPGATPSISANGTRNGVVWVLDASGYSSGNAAVLHAYDASNTATELYNSNLDVSDAPGVAVKFAVPTIANGKVYVGGQYQLTVYGPLSR